ncbi:MAG: hypothetical protein EPN88_00555, partial [Bacteroidetes bacterium]
MKIPIKYVIDSGAWFQCHSKMYEKYFDFRLKLFSFKKIDLADIDEPNKIDNFDSEEGNLWLMKLQIVNLNKKEVASGYITGSI